MDKDGQGTKDAELVVSKSRSCSPKALVYVRSTFAELVRSVDGCLRRGIAKLTCGRRSTLACFRFACRLAAFRLVIYVSGVADRCGRRGAHLRNSVVQALRSRLSPERVLKTVSASLPVMFLRSAVARLVRSVHACVRRVKAKLARVWRPTIASCVSALRPAVPGLVTYMSGTARRGARRFAIRWQTISLVLRDRLSIENAVQGLRQRTPALFLFCLLFVAFLLQAYVPTSAQTGRDQNGNSNSAVSRVRAYLLADHDLSLVESVSLSTQTADSSVEREHSWIDVCTRTAQVRDVIVGKVDGIESCADLTKAHLSKITSLNLSGRGITGLKAGDFNGLSALRLLKLSENRLTDLPESLFDDLASLKSLYLNNNQLEELSGGSFKGLSSLEILYLYDNSLDALPRDVFEGLVSLEQLNLTSNSLDALPANLFDPLAKLEILRLGWNELAVIPDELFEKLTRLKYLNVIGNPGLGRLERSKFTEAGPSHSSGQMRTERISSDEPVRVSVDKPVPKTNVTFAWAEADAVETPDSPLVVSASANIPTDTDIDRVMVADAAPDQTDVSLSSFSISYGATPIPFTSYFTSELTSYKAWVPSTVDIVTLVAQPVDTGARLLYVPTDVDDNPDNGHQVILAAEGVTLISVTVIGTDGKNIRTYMASVLRQGPIICWPPYGATAAAVAVAGTLLGGEADARNFEPSFGFANGTVSLAENVGDVATDTAMNIGFPFTATDIDGDNLTYSLAGTDAALFDVVEGTGQITSKAGVNYDHETKPSHSVTVTVSDGQGGSDTIGVTILVTDMNEPPLAPGQPVVSTVSGSKSSLSVSWTPPSNTGRPDIRGYGLQYREGTSGTWTNGPQNVTDTHATISGLSEDTSYQVQVMATNDEGVGPRSSPGSGRTNRNNPPRFAAENATRSLTENVGDAATTSAENLGDAFMATDDDSEDTLTYSIEGINYAIFTIDSNSGQLPVQDRGQLRSRNNAHPVGHRQGQRR